MYKSIRQQEYEQVIILLRESFRLYQIAERNNINLRGNGLWIEFIKLNSRVNQTYKHNWPDGDMVNNESKLQADVGIIGEYTMLGICHYVSNIRRTIMNEYSTYMIIALVILTGLFIIGCFLGSIHICGVIALLILSLNILLVGMNIDD